ncbi:MAG: LLM class flavin-dependent oxidoreductase [Acidimicrobiales bacterium]
MGDRGTVRLGLDLLGGAVPESFEEVARWAATAEANGFDGAWVTDDPLSGTAFEATTLLGGLAVRTSTLRLGTIVPPGPGRTPAITAKVLSAVDLLSGGGRLVAGVGAGQPTGPHDDAGPHGDAGDRRLVEALAIVRALFGGEPVTSSGPTWRLAGAVNQPPPAHGSTTPLVIEVAQVPSASLAGAADVLVVRSSPDRVAAVAQVAGTGSHVGRTALRHPVVLWRGRAVLAGALWDRDAHDPRGVGADPLATVLDLSRPEVCAQTVRALGQAGASGVIVAVEDVGQGNTSSTARPEELPDYNDAIAAAGRLLSAVVADELGQAG